LQLGNEKTCQVAVESILHHKAIYTATWQV